MMMSHALKYRGTFLPVVKNAILDGWSIIIVVMGFLVCSTDGGGGRRS